MKDYHAVMIDETGCEFGVTLRARDMTAAREQLEEDYPESRIDEIRSVSAWEQAQRDREEFFLNGGDYDEDGRPFYHY